MFKGGFRSRWQERGGGGSEGHWWGCLAPPGSKGASLSLRGVLSPGCVLAPRGFLSPGDTLSGMGVLPPGDIGHSLLKGSPVPKEHPVLHGGLVPKGYLVLEEGTLSLRDVLSRMGCCPQGSSFPGWGSSLQGIFCPRRTSCPHEVMSYLRWGSCLPSSTPWDIFHAAHTVAQLGTHGLPEGLPVTQPQPLQCPHSARLPMGRSPGGSSQLFMLMLCCRKKGS